MRQTTNPNHGDYVLCCKYSDRRPEDQWQVGFLDCVFNVHGRKLFVMQSPERYYFKVCYWITSGEGDRIIKSGNPKVAHLNSCPVSPYSQSDYINEESWDKLMRELDALSVLEENTDPDPEPLF